MVGDASLGDLAGLWLLPIEFQVQAGKGRSPSHYPIHAATGSIAYKHYLFKFGQFELDYSSWIIRSATSPVWLRTV